MLDRIAFKIQGNGEVFSGAIEKEPCSNQAPHALDGGYCAICQSLIQDSIKRCLTDNKEDFKEPTP